MYRILIIEDEEDIRDNIKELFERDGNEVHCASNGNEGIIKAIQLDPDLILCDIMMPGLDGFQVKKKLSENKKTQVIPFIFLTAKVEIQNMRDGMNLGADDYIVKPVRTNELLKVVYSRLQRIEQLQIKYIEKKTSPRLTIDDKILVNTNKENILIPLNNILFFEVNGNYTKVTTINGKSVIQKKSLKSWEEILPEKIFIRVHNKTIINFNYIEKIEPYFNGSLIIRVKNYSESIQCSQRYSVGIKKMFNK